MRNIKQPVITNKSVQQLEPNNEELKIPQVSEDDSVTQTDENDNLREYGEYLLQFFMGSLKKVLEEDGISSESISRRHIIRTLFKMQNVGNGKLIIGSFLAECKQAIEEFNLFSSLADEGKLSWLLRETLNPGYIWEQYNDAYKTLRIPH